MDPSSQQPHRAPAPAKAFLILAPLLVGAGVWAQLQMGDDTKWAVASAVQAGASIIFAWLLGAPPALPLEPSNDGRPLERWETVAASALIAAGAMLYLGAAILLTWQWSMWFDLAAPAAVAGMGLAVGGFGIVDRRRGRFLLTGTSIPAGERLVVAGIVLLAFYLRFHRWDFFPPPDGISTIEENQTGMVAWDVLHGARPWEFIMDRWLAAAALGLGGNNLTALRIPFAIASALTVVPLYWLLRCLTQRWVAVVVSALFAVCHWHLIYARYAHNIFFTTIVVVFLLFLLVRARQDGRLAPYPLIGFLAALTLYGYAGYRGTFLWVGGFMLLDLWRCAREVRRTPLPQARQRASAALRHRVAGIVVAAFAFLPPIAPLTVEVQSNPNYSYFEAAQRSLLNRDYYTNDPTAFLKQRLHRIAATAMIFNQRGDDTYTMNTNSEPMLDPYVGGCLALAIAFALLRWRHRDLGFFLGLFVFLLLGGAVFVQNLDVRRLQSVIPILYVLLALVFDRVRAVVAGAAGRPGNAVLALAAIALCGGAALSNYDFFFHRFIYDPVVRGYFKNGYTIGIRHLHSLPQGSFQMQVSDIGNFFEENDYAWWRGEPVPGMLTHDLAPLWNGEGGPWSGRDVYVALEDPYDSAALQSLLREAFPNLFCTVLRDTDQPRLTLTSCHVGLGVPVPRPPTAGARARYFHERERQPFLERIEPAIAFAFTPDPCREPTARRPCRAEWEGVWDIPPGGLAGLLAQTRPQTRTIEVFVDDQPLRNTPRDLTGPHRVRVTADYDTNGYPGVQLMYTQPGGETALVRMSQPEPPPAPAAPAPSPRE